MPHAPTFGNTCQQAKRIPHYDMLLNTLLHAPTFGNTCQQAHSPLQHFVKHPMLPHLIKHVNRGHSPPRHWSHNHIEYNFHEQTCPLRVNTYTEHPCGSLWIIIKQACLLCCFYAKNLGTLYQADQLCISLSSSGPGYHEDQETDAELPPLAREL
jgi:hypothetical protein